MKIVALGTIRYMKDRYVHKLNLSIYHNVANNSIPLLKKGQQFSKWLYICVQN